MWCGVGVWVWHQRLIYKVSRLGMARDGWARENGRRKTERKKEQRIPKIKIKSRS